MSNDIKVIEYSEKAIVVQGEDTRKFKESLKSLGGKYNGRLRTGPGWIFPKNMKSKIEQAIESDFKNMKSYKDYSSNSTTSNSTINTNVIDLIKNLNNKVDNLEKLIRKLLNEKNDIVIEDITDTDSDDDTESENENIKPKRLLHRKKND
jgi:DNA polymerase II small subunit/DNA polymerase delta subunit B